MLDERKQQTCLGTKPYSNCGVNERKMKMKTFKCDAMCGGCGAAFSGTLEAESETHAATMLIMAELIPQRVEEASPEELSEMAPDARDDLGDVIAERMARVLDDFLQRTIEGFRPDSSQPQILEVFSPFPEVDYFGPGGLDAGLGAATLIMFGGDPYPEPPAVASIDFDEFVRSGLASSDSPITLVEIPGDGNSIGKFFESLEEEPESDQVRMIGDRGFQIPGRGRANPYDPCLDLDFRSPYERAFGPRMPFPPNPYLRGPRTYPVSLGPLGAYFRPRDPLGRLGNLIGNRDAQGALAELRDLTGQDDLEFETDLTLQDLDDKGIDVDTGDLPEIQESDGPDAVVVPAIDETDGEVPEDQNPSLGEDLSGLGDLREPETEMVPAEAIDVQEDSETPPATGATDDVDPDASTDGDSQSDEKAD